MSSCSQAPREKHPADMKMQLKALMDTFYEQRMAFFPIESTWAGETKYNDKLFADFTDSYRSKVKGFYAATLDSLHAIDRESLDENDKISYDYLDSYLTTLQEEYNYHFNYIPTDQMWGFHLRAAILGSGSSAQPFKTVADYRNWLKRIDGYELWMDSAIVYFSKGMETGITLPKPLVEKMIPQFESMVTKTVEENLFYTPVKNFPEGISEQDRTALKAEYANAVIQKVIPMHKRMADFLKNEYLPKARTTSGYSGMLDGEAYYRYCVKLNTTTDKSPEEIYETGLKEVARIRKEMESIKDSVGFKGDLNAFFNYLRTDKKFFPYKSPDEILKAFNNIYGVIKPHLNEQFGFEPTTPFEIRQTEAFRAETASAEYNPSPDNIKPGIFYVPILDATKFNYTSGMESLFLHEAIPGHHYQISLQRENKSLPKIRQYDPWSNAYVEGWALYCESLGHDLGLYTDPYQRMGALGDEIHRAIRLVVDVALHTGKMTREDAIKYMMDNEPASLQYATMEIERYMSGPGQALGYKTGSMKIRELRAKYEKQLGAKFKITEFHHELLKDGSMPLAVLEQKMDRWAERVAKGN